MTKVEGADVPPAAKLKDILEKTTKFFREKDCDSPRLDAELLLAKALGLRRIDLYLKYDQPLSEAELASCRELVRRRSKGEPVAYILGQKEFYGLNFFVDKNVLIPRPETELLVEAVLESTKKRAITRETLEILDLGCGSGCIGLSLLHLNKNARATLLDISEAAVGVAKKNAESLELADRCNLICGDAAESSFGERSFDIIVANPPYISPTDTRVQDDVVNFEPHLALFSPNDGLAANFSWSKNLVSHLRPKGIMCFEFGIDQSPMVLQHFEKLGIFSELKIIKDLAGIDRHILAIRKDS